MLYKNKEGIIKIFNQLIKFKKYKNYKLILAGAKLTQKMKCL